VCLIFNHDDKEGAGGLSSPDNPFNKDTQMTTLNFDSADKQKIEEVINEISNVPEYERDAFLEKFSHGRAPAWQRFVKAGYNQPITWWIGVIQCQMQMGIWGQRYKGNAQVTASLFNQITKPVQDELIGLAFGGDAPITKAAFSVCKKHFKADMSGRFAAGFFTNYVSTGGRFGKGALSKTSRTLMAITNFAVAGYGAAIQAIANGMTTKEAVIQSMLIGKASNVLRSDPGEDLSEEDAVMFEKFCAVCPEIFNLAHIAPGPVPISEFCLRPENVNLRGVCR